MLFLQMSFNLSFRKTSFVNGLSAHQMMLLQSKHVSINKLYRMNNVLGCRLPVLSLQGYAIPPPSVQVCTPPLESQHSHRALFISPFNHALA